MRICAPTVIHQATKSSASTATLQSTGMGDSALSTTNYWSQKLFKKKGLRPNNSLGY
jgi:hypothetical protein